MSAGGGGGSGGSGGWLWILLAIAGGVAGAILLADYLASREKYHCPICSKEIAYRQPVCHNCRRKLTWQT